MIEANLTQSLSVSQSKNVMEEAQMSLSKTEDQKDKVLHEKVRDVQVISSGVGWTA